MPKKLEWLDFAEPFTVPRDLAPEDQTAYIARYELARAAYYRQFLQTQASAKWHESMALLWSSKTFSKDALQYSAPVDDSLPKTDQELNDAHIVQVEQDLKDASYYRQFPKNSNMRAKVEAREASAQSHLSLAKVPKH